MVGSENVFISFEHLDMRSVLDKIAESQGGTVPFPLLTHTIASR